MANKSQKIRQIFKKSNHKLTISKISKKAGVRYQFAYQVIKRYCSKNNITMPTNKQKQTKAAKIRKLYDKGLTIGAISKKLNTNYTYVWSVCDKYRKSE